MKDQVGFPTEIRSLTGLRGVAAGYVVLYHFLSFGPGLAGNMLRHGYLAVDLFFVLSGFVMAMTYSVDFETKYNPVSHLRFLGKRLGRVYPLYIVATLLCAVLAYSGYLSQTSVSSQSLLGNIFLVQAWGLTDSLDGPAWSISTEMAAYLLFPAFACLMLFRSWGVACVMVFAVVCSLMFVASRSDASINQVVDGLTSRAGLLDVHDCRTVYPMIRCLSGFLLGLFAWRSINIPEVKRLFQRRSMQWMVVSLAFILLAIPRSDVIEILLFVPLVMGLSVTSSSASRFFGFKLIYQLGVISYSLYLAHFPLQQVTEPLIAIAKNHFSHGYSLVGVLLIGPTLAISVFLFHFVESPGRAWSRRLITRGPRVMPVGPAPVN